MLNLSKLIGKMHNTGDMEFWQWNPISKAAPLSVVCFLQSPEKGTAAGIKTIKSYNFWAVSAQ